ADVFGGQRHAFRRQIVGIDEVADRFADARPQAIFMRAARSGRNAVYIRADVFVGRFSPLQHEVESQPFITVLNERDVVYGLGATLRDDLLLIIDEAFGVFDDHARFGAFVLEDDLDA